MLNSDFSLNINYKKLVLDINNVNFLNIYKNFFYIMALRI